TAAPARPAPGVEDPRPTRHHRIDQPGLPDGVLPPGDHRTEPFDVPRRMRRILRHDLLPPARHPLAATVFRTLAAAHPRSFVPPGHRLDPHHPHRYVVGNATHGNHQQENWYPSKPPRAF